MTSNYKAVGGVERAALYPADAVATALFSSEGCEVELSGEPIEVELLEDMSSFEECSDSRSGVTKISHQLNLVADRREAGAWFDEAFVERCSIEGVVAVVSLCDGRRLLVGYSARFGDEQPLHLSSLTFASGSCLHDKPTATLRLVSHDTEFSQEIL
ncbi:MAG: hypothetical protein IKA04_06630 [Alistipes sp.]|nr:hypothetical protein [Alistipes sp.]